MILTSDSRSVRFQVIDIKVQVHAATKLLAKLPEFWIVIIIKDRIKSGTLVQILGPHTFFLLLSVSLSLAVLGVRQSIRLWQACSLGRGLWGCPCSNRCMSTGIGRPLSAVCNWTLEQPNRHSQHSKATCDCLKQKLNGSWEAAAVSAYRRYLLPCHLPSSTTMWYGFCMVEQIAQQATELMGHGISYSRVSYTLFFAFLSATDISCTRCFL